MKVSQSSLLLLSSTFFLDQSHSFTVNNITCDDLPISIDTDIVFDRPLDLSRCPRRGNSFPIFNVTNDSTMDCDGNIFSGFRDSVGFYFVGGGAVTNCHMKSHDISILCEADYSKSSTLIINDVLFSDVSQGVVVEGVTTSGVGSETNFVNILVENCHLIDVKRQAISFSPYNGSLQVIGSSVIGSSSPSGVRGTGIQSIGDETGIVSINIRDTYFSNLYEGVYIEMPVNMINITNVDIQDIQGGIYIMTLAENISISNARVNSAERYGIVIDSETSMNWIDLLQLDDVSVCNSAESPAHVWFSDDIGKVEVSGDLICNEANEGVTSYCTKICPNSLVSHLHSKWKVTV